MTKETVPPAVINLYFFLWSDFISDKKDIYYFTLLENTLSWWHHASRLQMSILCLKEFLLFKESKIASSLLLFDWLTDLIFQEELWSLKNQIYAMRISQFVKTKEFKIFHPIDIFHFKFQHIIFSIFSIMLFILIMNNKIRPVWLKVCIEKNSLNCEKLYQFY